MRKPCGLITMIPSALETEWAERLAELIQPFKPAALILQVPSAGAPANLLANAQAAELAVLFVDAVHQTREMGANGVYLSTPGSGVSNVRRELGASSIIGAACGLSRHAAMESAEAGADFVAFDASSPENMTEAAELSSWWDEITVVPSALFCGRTLPDRSILARARADFVILKEAERPGESLTFATEFGLQSQS
jgi:thiamine-phosphate pyrophosphorylase